MTGKTILITRGTGDGGELREELQSLGHHVIHEPLTEIFLNHTARHELQDAINYDPDAILITSRHGVRALATLNETRDIPILCVGNATVEVAESLGFSRVCMAGSNSEEMTQYIIDAYDADARFIYASAKHIRNDLNTLLDVYGFTINRLILYEAIASEALSDTLVEQLKREQVDAATFLSQRSAEIFISLLTKLDMLEITKNLEVFCLSDAVAQPLQGCAWKSIVISKEATLASLVASVDNAEL